MGQWRSQESELGGSPLLPPASPPLGAYFNVPTGTDVLGDLKSVLEGFVARA